MVVIECGIEKDLFNRSLLADIVLFKLPRKVFKTRLLGRGFYPL